jgi:carbamoyltransferase
LAEAGPRALGNRSILFDARDKNAKDKVNSIKKREWYRPFAGMVLEEDANKFFDMGHIIKSQHMTVSFPVKDSALEVIPGVVHVDNTCRIQTIDKTNINIFELLNEFKKITGVGIILNTSFNLAGYPLVETPQNALDTLMSSSLDYVWFPEISKIVSRDDLQ